MGLFGRIVIALLLSPVFCKCRSRQGLASILQNLLASNPQALKMIANKQICNNAVNYAPYAYETQGPVVQSQYLSNCQSPQYVRKQPTVIEMPYPVAQPQVFKEYQVQNYQAPAIPVQSVVPVQPVKEIAYQYPVSQQVQTVTQSYQAPACPNPYTSPASLVNPFLPAASPVSAMAPPTSSLLPPVNPRVTKNHFLRKIPFPPPCL